MSASVAAVTPAGPGSLPGSLLRLELQSVCRSVPWRTPADLGSAAFWVDQTVRSRLSPSYRMGVDLFEEAAACLLGGHGVTGPMTVAAFERLRDRGLLAPGAEPSEAEYASALLDPLVVGGRVSRYRFPAQRAARLARLARAVPDAPQEGPALRDWLMTLPGFGPKTASWAARNHTGCDHLAVIDIHVRRAGELAGVFCRSWRLPRDYGVYESAFVQWAGAGGVRASDLDACIWHQLSTLGPRARVLFG